MLLSGRHGKLGHCFEVRGTHSLDTDAQIRQVDYAGYTASTQVQTSTEPVWLTEFWVPVYLPTSEPLGSDPSHVTVGVGMPFCRAGFDPAATCPSDPMPRGSRGKYARASV